MEACENVYRDSVLCVVNHVGPLTALIEDHTTQVSENQQQVHASRHDYRLMCLLILGDYAGNFCNVHSKFNRKSVQV
jgi:hypothetical protein